MESYQYTAFISYRHSMLDMQIARRLHSLIENYPIPPAVQKMTNRRKMGRVFRDQDELPLAVDLGEDIRKALENSEWLIVICSPRLPQSGWCMQEIETFIRLGKRDRILTILVEGEPEESFPPQLCTIEKDGHSVPIEPLAADVRGRNLAESLRKLRREKLRLLAPMLGLNYDALRQRAKARQQRIRLRVMAAVLALVTAFGVYAAVQNRRIAQERDAARSNEMQLLIEKANVEVSGGNKRQAKRYLQQAGQLRGAVGEQHDALLSDALEYALYTGPYEPVLTIDAPNRRFSSALFSADDTKLLAVTNMNSVSLIDLADGSIRYTVSIAMTGSIDQIGFLDDDAFFYVLDAWYGTAYVYHTSDGSPAAVYRADPEQAMALGEKAFPMHGHQLLLVQKDQLLLWNYLTDTLTAVSMDSAAPRMGYVQPLIVEAFHDGRRLAVGSAGFDDPCYVLDIVTGERIVMQTEMNRGYNGLKLSRNDTYLAAASGSLICVFSTVSGEQVCAYDASAAGFGSVCEYLLSDDGSRLVTADVTGIRCFSIPDGTLLWETGEAGPDLSGPISMALSPDGRAICYSAVDRGTLDMQTGRLVSSASGVLFSHDGSMLLLNGSQDTPQIAVTNLSATVQKLDAFTGALYKSERNTAASQSRQFVLSHPTGSLYSFAQPRLITDPTQSYHAYAHSDGFVEIFSAAADQDTAIAAYGEHCYNAVTDLAFHGQLLASAGGYGQNAVLFDCGRSAIRHVFRCGGYAGGVEFSPDGTKLMVLWHDRTLNSSTVSVFSTDTGKLLFSMEAGSAGVRDFGFTQNGSQAVLLLEDGSAVVGGLYVSLSDMLDGLK